MLVSLGSEPSCCSSALYQGSSRCPLTSPIRRGTWMLFNSLCCCFPTGASIAAVGSSLGQLQAALSHHHLHKRVLPAPGQDEHTHVALPACRAHSQHSKPKGSPVSPHSKPSQWPSDHLSFYRGSEQGTTKQLKQQDSEMAVNLWEASHIAKEIFVQKLCRLQVTSVLLHHATTLWYHLGIHTGARQTSHKEATKLTVSPTAAQRAGFARYYCNTPN